MKKRLNAWLLHYFGFFPFNYDWQKCYANLPNFTVQLEFGGKTELTTKGCGKSQPVFYKCGVLFTADLPCCLFISSVINYYKKKSILSVSLLIISAASLQQIIRAFNVKSSHIKLWLSRHCDKKCPNKYVCYHVSCLSFVLTQQHKTLKFADPTRFLSLCNIWLWNGIVHM